MPLSLLSTKLAVPAFRRKLVSRPGLVERLNRGLEKKLVLISAPAGYGKTTLLCQWASTRAGPVGWVSLDRSDSDPAQFLGYLLSAVQKIDPAVGLLIPGMLHPPQPVPAQTVWTALINDLAASHKEFVLILDDYHEVESQAVHEVLAFFIEHLPQNLHLVLSTRADPPFNLPQLRARGQLLELRAADLCFSPADAKSFYHDLMDLPLADGEVEALMQKAEGWAAGLQISAIVLQNRAHLSQAVEAFTGSHRHILDYLAVEVIERLPEPIQDFLCQTSILEDLEASLCDAVTGRCDSRQILAQLEHENTFIIPLDDERRWFRYHHLMAEALRRRTVRLGSAQLTELHRRASAWFEAQGRIGDAVEHAFKAGDFERAAELIEGGAEEVLKRSQTVTLLGWLDQLPGEQVRRRPRLNIAYAWALLLKGGSPPRVLEKLENAAGQGAGGWVSAEEAVIRALVAVLSGEVDRSLTYSRGALEDLPSDSSYLRSIAAGSLGMACVLKGDIESAIQAFKESVALARESGNIMFAVASLSNLAGLHILQGHLQMAAAVYRQALELATTQYGQRLPVACRALMGLGEIAREWNDLERARQLLEEAIRLSRQYNETGELVMVLSLSRVLQSRGDREAALDLVLKAQAIAIQSTSTAIDDRLVDAALVRLWLMQGNQAAVEEWSARRGLEQAASRGVLPLDRIATMPYDLFEVEWMLVARLQLVQHRVETALRILTALLNEAQSRGRTRRLIEIRVLLALAYQEQGSLDLALDILEGALSSSEPEGYTRVYIDEGQPMSRLLREAARRGIRVQECSRLLAVFQQEGQTQEHDSGEFPPGLVEPLSDRELEVLQLLAEGCTNRVISERLYISLSTVKGHVSNIFGKLLASNRTEVVAKARALGILPET